MAVDPKKVSQLDRIGSLPSGCGFYVVTALDGTPGSKVIEMNDFFGSIPNTAIDGTLAVEDNVDFNGNTFNCSANTNINAKLQTSQLVVANTRMRIGSQWSPANSTSACTKGDWGFNSTYAYFAVANNSIKRVALSSF